MTAPTEDREEEGVKMTLKSAKMWSTLVFGTSIYAQSSTGDTLTDQRPGVIQGARFPSFGFWQWIRIVPSLPRSLHVYDW